MSEARKANQKRRRWVNHITNEVVEILFVNGAGEEAERLVLTAKDGRDLGGYSKAAVIDHLLRILTAGALQLASDFSSLGGKAAAAKMTAKHKTRRAKRAAKARWSAVDAGQAGG